MNAHRAPTGTARSWPCAHFGCKRTTTDASLLCHDHRGARRRTQSQRVPAPAAPPRPGDGAPMVFDLASTATPGLLASSLGKVLGAAITQAGARMDGGWPGDSNSNQVVVSFTAVLLASAAADPDLDAAALLAHLARPTLDDSVVDDYRDLAGMTPEQAAPWARWGISAAEARDWRAAGVSADHLAARHRAGGVGPALVVAVGAGERPSGWSRVGEDLRKGAPFATVETRACAVGAAPDTAATFGLLVQGWSREEVVMLRAGGIGPDAAREAREAGVTNAATVLDAAAMGIPLSWAATGS